jgi:hypothetical protein
MVLEMCEFIGMLGVATSLITSVHFSPLSVDDVQLGQLDNHKTAVQWTRQQSAPCVKSGV